jgi:hypothetical protein
MENQLFKSYILKLIKYLKINYNFIIKMKSNEKISNYSMKEKLGKGSYGEVYRVEEKCKF